MAKEVIFSKRAEQRLEDIIDHVHDNFSAEKAIEVYRGLRSKIKSLGQFPRLGKVSARFMDCRELVVERNVVFYRVEDDRILILTIRPRLTKS